MLEISAQWLWVFLGIGLFIAEIFTTTFVLLFFGSAALVVGLLKFIGLNNLYAELSLFALLGLAGIGIFRRKLLRSVLARSNRAVDGVQHAHLQLDVTIPPHGSAQITHLGTPWTALNPSDHTLQVGDRVIVERAEGIKLVLKKLL